MSLTVGRSVGTVTLKCLRVPNGYTNTQRTDQTATRTLQTATQRADIFFAQKMYLSQVDAIERGKLRTSYFTENPFFFGHSDQGEEVRRTFSIKGTRVAGREENDKHQRSQQGHRPDGQLRGSVRVSDMYRPAREIIRWFDSDGSVRAWEIDPLERPTSAGAHMRAQGCAVSGHCFGIRAVC